MLNSYHIYKKKNFGEWLSGYQNFLEPNSIGIEVSKPVPLNPFSRRLTSTLSTLHSIEKRLAKDYEAIVIIKRYLEGKDSYQRSKIVSTAKALYKCLTPKPENVKILSDPKVVKLRYVFDDTIHSINVANGEKSSPKSNPGKEKRNTRIRTLVDDYMKIEGLAREEAMVKATEKEACSMTTVERALGMRK